MHPVKAFFMSLGMYTRFPVIFKDYKTASPQLMLFNLIAVGGIIGLLWWMLYGFLTIFELPEMIFTAIIMLFPLWVSGYLHLEGFMDTSTQILSQKGGYNKSERHGVFGVIALAVLFVLNFASVNRFIEIKDTAELLIFIPIISRELTVLMIFLFPALSGGSIDYVVEKPSKKGQNIIIIMLIYIITIVLCITFTGMRGSILIIAMLCGFLFTAMSAKESVGITGDTAGYALTISESIGLLALAIFNF